MNDYNKANKEILSELEWVADLDNVDHDICNAALDAIHEIERLEKIIANLKKTEQVSR